MHQGKGLAKRMLQIVLDHGDRDRLPIYLEATPHGLALYKKNGFVECGEFSIADGRYTITLMIRQPGGEA
jgi:GNAT superfamily N-acetyltransferase